MQFNVSKVSSAGLSELTESNSISTVQLHYCNESQSTFFENSLFIVSQESCNINIKPEQYPKHDSCMVVIMCIVSLKKKKWDGITCTIMACEANSITTITESCHTHRFAALHWLFNMNAVFHLQSFFIFIHFLFTKLNTSCKCFILKAHQERVLSCGRAFNVNVYRKCWVSLTVI